MNDINGNIDKALNEIETNQNVYATGSKDNLGVVVMLNDTNKKHEMVVTGEITSMYNSLFISSLYVSHQIKSEK